MRQLISNKTKSLPVGLVVVSDAAELARIVLADPIIEIGTILQAATPSDEYVVWGVGDVLSASPKIVQGQGS